jgi:hypothetical protein
MKKLLVVIAVFALFSLCVVAAHATETVTVTASGINNLTLPADTPTIQLTDEDAHTGNYVLTAATSGVLTGLTVHHNYTTDEHLTAAVALHGTTAASDLGLTLTTAITSGSGNGSATGASTIFLNGGAAAGTTTTVATNIAAGANNFDTTWTVSHATLGGTVAATYTYDVTFTAVAGSG